MESIFKINGRHFSLVLLLTLIIRLIVLFALPAGLTIDTDGYRRIAITLRTTGTYGIRSEPGSESAPSVEAVTPTAYRPPLYPLLLSTLVYKGKLWPLGIGALHLVLGCTTVACVLWLGQAWQLGRWSLVAGLLTACDPILLHQSTQIMTETLATFCAVAAFLSLTLTMRSMMAVSEYHSMRKLHALQFCSGVVLGLACLCRPTFLPWGGLILISLLVRDRRGKSLLMAATYVFGILVALAPWGLRNYARFGHFKITTTHGGYTLLLGNNPSFYRYLREAPWGTVWSSEELDRKWTNRKTVSEGEFGDDRLAYRSATEFIQAEPLMFVWSCFVRVARLWNVLPHRLSESEPIGKTALRLLIALWYVGIYALSIWTVVLSPKRLTRPPWLWGLLLCLAFSVVHLFYWSDMRMRAPLMPFVYLLALAGMEGTKKKS